MIQGRRRARQVVLQMLFQAELNPDSRYNWRAFCESRLQGQETLIVLAHTLYLGVLQNLSDLDQSIRVAMTRWNLERLSSVDRNILRLAVFEMKHFNTPPKVAIDEAIEIAKVFGGKNSPSFVNGALDRIYRDLNQPVASAELASANCPASVLPEAQSPNNISEHI